MKDGFTRKKVESLTLGEKMKKLRSDFRMSLSEVSKATRIQIKYLEYLEEGQYEKLPADVYVRGFLRSYARYLNIDEQVFVKLYERECNIQTNLGRDVARKTFHVKNLHISSFSVTPRSVMVACIFLVVGGAFFY
ncbi:MAG TPA: helix-turn-helix domain-containing protein, partial [Patescibacteria group bacterium]|nr:helix-turn-helix domain-containing protein [Patescibacteria group bacterium]